jgi:uncharacterized membrane protein/thiol-disulfide isomerase/thioredoxin
MAYLLSLLHVPYTRLYLQATLTEHPDYPSLLSVADVLGSSYNIASVALKLSREQLMNEPAIKPPFVAHIKSSSPGNGFALVTKISGESVELYNPGSKKTEHYTPAGFDKIFQGTILVVEADDSSGEKEFVQHRREEKRKDILQAFLLGALPVMTVLTCVITLFNGFTVNTLFPVAFTLLALAGSVIGVLLLWHEIDEHNPALKQICQAGKKVNCAAVLNSKGSKILGVSWSRIGFSYFGGLLLALLIAGITNQNTLELLAWLHLLTLPYIGYSVYYQWRIAKQWCMLCLLVQGVLLLLFLTALVGGFYGFMGPDAMRFSSWLAVMVPFLFVFVAVQLLIPAFLKVKEGRNKGLALQRLKHNPQIFEALLAKQKRLEHSPEKLGITLGRADAKFKLIKVCNPYCGPCAKAHPDMERLLENNEDVQLQIIFTASEYENDMKAPPVQHLLAIAAKGDERITKKALDDWYLSPEKDYSIFAGKYPMGEELPGQREKIKQMREWCDAVGIAFTPTFYVNGYQLPEMYTVADLKYFLST